MANIQSAAVIAIDAASPPVVAKNAYRGNAQIIPIVLSTDAADGSHTLELSKVLPPDAKLIAISLEHTAIGGTGGTLSIGYTGDTDAIINAEDVSSAGSVVYPGLTTTVGAGGPIDVGGKAILGELEGTMSTDTINGYIVIVTDE